MSYRLIQNLFLGLVFVATAVFFHAHRDLFWKLATISLGHLSLLVIASMAFILANGCQFKYLMRLFGIRLKLYEWFGLTVVNTLYNYYVPARGGSVSRAMYLKYRHGFSFSHYLSLNAGAYLVNFILASFSASFFVLIYYWLYDRFFGKVFSISIALFTVTLTVSVILFKSIGVLGTRQQGGRLWRFTHTVGEGLHLFRDNWGVLGVVFAAKLAFILVTSAKLYIAFHAIGLRPNFLCILIIGSLIVFSMVISLTPGNLGIKEGIIGLLASMLGVTLKDAILGAILDRAVTMLIVIFLGLIFSYILLKNVPQETKSLTTDPVERL